MSSTDRRVVRTKNAIRRAFFKLLDERDYDKITVAALAREADIDRKTFYLHYASIDDVVDEIIHENAERIVAGLEKGGSPVGIQQRLDVENFFMLLSTDLAYDYAGESRWILRFPMEILLRKAESALTELLIERDVLGLGHLGESLEYCVSFLCAGLISVYRRWLVSDSEMPLEELAQMARTLAFTGLEGALEKSNAQDSLQGGALQAAR